ncbi:MAG: dienelactone hydrolase family protein [Labilithrix sp.]|nr:dienelactone hydrolase family protein [Labilithrix sp.]
MLVNVPAADVMLAGDLTVPPHPCGIVLFAHGSGSSRQSPRNQLVARELNDAAPPLATLLIDLLTEEEEGRDRWDAHLRFDIGLLARRLIAVTDWLTMHGTPGLPVGYFGASTGAGAALVAAAERPDAVVAIVSRGGRPDLAGAALERVRAPTLLLVGSNDPLVIDLNEMAARVIPAEVVLDVIPGASHLFEEPGKLAEVARRATRWFHRYLGGAVTSAYA